MLKFEIKKIIKSKTLIATIIFSIIMSIYVNYKSNNEFDISSQYPTYEIASSPEVVFMHSFFSQYFKLKNREEAYSEFDESMKKTVRYFHSKVQGYLSNKKEQNFSENYNIAKYLQKIDYNHLQEVKDIKEKYNIEINDKQKKASYEYGIFEYEYYNDNNIIFTKENEEFLSTNYVRRIIYNSNIIFGLPFIIFMIIVFHGVLSKEKSQGTINLLRSQPIKKILYSKFISMIFISIIYIITFFISFLIICLAQGINIGEYREIFPKEMEKLKL